MKQPLFFILFFLSITNAHILNESDLRDARHIFLTPLSSSGFSKVDSYSVMKNFLSGMAINDPALDETSPNFLSRFLTYSSQTLLEISNLQNVSKNELFELFMKKMEEMKEEIKACKFDTFSNSFDIYLKQAALLETVQQLENKKSFASIKIDSNKIQSISSKALEIFRESKNAHIKENWESLKNAILDKIKAINKAINGGFNQLVSLQKSPAQFLKFEILNLILYTPVTQDNMNMQTIKLLEMLEVFGSLQKDPTSLEAIAITILQVRSKEPRPVDKNRQIFLVSAVKKIFDLLQANNFLDNIAFITRNYIRSKVKVLSDPILSMNFGSNYARNFLPGVRESDLTTNRFWAFQTWDFLAHLDSKTPTHKDHVLQIVEKFWALFEIEEEYIESYPYVVSLLSNLTGKEWSDSNYFNIVWQFSLQFRLSKDFKNEKTWANRFDKFLNGILHDERFDGLHKYLIILKLQNAILNGEKDSSDFEFPNLSTPLLLEVSELVSEDSFAKFDEVLKYLYISNDKRFDDRTVKDKLYIHGISGKNIPAVNILALQPTQEKFIEAKGTRILNKNWISAFETIINLINEKSEYPNLIKELKGKLENSEYNFSRLTPEIDDVLKNQNIFEFNDGVKTVFSYVHLVQTNTPCYEALAADL